MCNCLEKKKEQLKILFEKKNAKSGYMVEQIFTHSVFIENDKIVEKTTTDFTVRYHTGKRFREQQVHVKHEFCPFCGEQYK